MLTIHFINVWDGDAILFESHTGNRCFRMLVDTGNALIPRGSGLRRVTALEYLKQHKIHTLDLVVITHLHMDHFGDLQEIAKQIEIRNLYAPYIPGAAERAYIQPCGDPVLDKSMDGLCECLNLWVSTLGYIRDKQDCRIRQIFETRKNMELLPGLLGDIIVTDSAQKQAQNAVYDKILRQEEVSFQMMYWASKMRNPGSLRMNMTYAGRKIVMGADCFGALWEQEAAPCDIFKVPHHGDRKALTEKLAAGLHPSYAVISCGSEYIERKDRPSAGTISLLKQYGAQVYYTDAFAPEDEEPVIHDAIIMEIREDGTIHVSA